MADDARKKAIELAVKELLAAGKGLGADKRPTVEALSDHVGFKVNAQERDKAYTEATKESPPVKKPRAQTANPPKGYDDLHLETIVQIAAKCMRNGRHIEGNGRPSHLRLTSLAAFPVTPEACEWACAEAYRRSESLDHHEIVSQHRLEHPAEHYEQAREPEKASA